MLGADAAFAATFDGEEPADAAARRRRRALGQSACWAAFGGGGARAPPPRAGPAPCARALWALARAVRDGGFGRLAGLRLRAADLSVLGGGEGGGGGAAAALATALGGSRGMRTLDLRQCEVAYIIIHYITLYTI